MYICGKVVNSIGYAQTGGGYKYKVKIRKANGRDTTFITNKEIFSRCQYYNDIIFDVDVVYKKNGKLDGKNSNINQVYVVGEDITEEEYAVEYNNQKTIFQDVEKPLDAGSREKRENNLYTISMTLLVIAVLALSVVKVISQDRFMKDTKNFDIANGEVTYISVSDTATSDSDKVAHIWVTYCVEGQNYEIRESARGKTFLTNNVDGMSRGSKVKILYNPQNPQEGYLSTYSDFGKRYVPMYGGTYFSGYAMILVSSVAVVLLLVHYIRRITKKKTLYMQLGWPALWIVASIIYSVRYSFYYIFGIVFSVIVFILVFMAVVSIKAKKGNI